MPVEHNTLTASSLHEILGHDSATAGQVPVFDGAGSSSPGNKETYGAFNDVRTPTDNYTLVLADQGRFIQCNKSTAMTLTIPPNASVAFPTLTRIDGGQYGAGQVTITPGAGVTLRSKFGNLKTSVQYGVFSLTKIGTNEWWVSGDLTA